MMAEDAVDLFAADGDLPVHFIDGLCGFEDVLEYTLMRESAGDPVMVLQAAGLDVPSFVVLDPFAIYPGYAPVVPDRLVKELGAETETDLLFLAIAVVHDDFSDTVANLKSPVVVNRRTARAQQVIMEDCDYPIRYPVFAREA